jgi:DNA-binding winged helix-turn-helix (wHTH) protein
MGHGSQGQSTNTCCGCSNDEPPCGHVGGRYAERCAAHPPKGPPTGASSLGRVVAYPGIEGDRFEIRYWSAVILRSHSGHISGGDAWRRLASMLDLLKLIPMEETSQPTDIVRFGVFEVDLRAEELRKNGAKLRLRGQPFQILAMLLERPGEIVTREELQQRLWPEGTFVDFDHSLNTAINKIREVLGDSAENPRFVETLPRRGYRFIATVENPGREIQTEKASPEAEALANANLNVGVQEKLLAEKEPPHRRSWWARGVVWLVLLC